MRQLASYSLHAQGAIEASAVLEKVDDWLGSKGTVGADGKELTFHDGRVASVVRSTTESSLGKITEAALTEPTGSGWFRTSVGVAESPSSLDVGVSLAAASASLSPLSLDVHCPRIVRDILALPIRWTYGGTCLTHLPIGISGDAGGDEFTELTWDSSRSVPIVAISDEYGAVLYPGIVEALARDLAGLAQVARLDPTASWRITRRKGKEWSCYGGAIRLYWPKIDASSSPFDHPLWTARRLLTDVADTESAGGRIRSQLRRRILGQSAFAVSEAPIFAAIRRSASTEELTALRVRAETNADYNALAEGYFNEVVKLQAALEELEEENASLKDQVRDLQLAWKWRDQEPNAIEPDPEVPPSTVEEAYLIALDQFADSLIFGENVEDGIRRLANDAGPPDKILTYLRELSTLTKAKRSGALGLTTVKWLESRGVMASQESQTIRNSQSEQATRTWGNGSGGSQTFNLHLKPSDATSPDRCVRIYFAYDDKEEKTRIGWIGPHP